ncbi:MAG: (d)CMP kinase [Acidimicrobiia bacterium]|nr:(d)CMP kinase [Acidimicrobiia bacterium]
MVIAIDGPSGVGKSTVSRLVAKNLGLAFLDTGATYRAATLAVLEAGVDPSDESEVLSELSGHSIDYDERGVLLDGRSVAFDVRSDAVTSAVSAVSAHPLVRAEVVNMQRRWVEHHDGRAVVEGRDIGTIVFPDAPLKIYMTASPLVRATRRATDSEAGGKSIEEIADALAQRDHADSSRAASPLRPADDAVIIDTGNMTIDEVVAQITSLVM